jgi:hypothetical protein
MNKKLLAIAIGGAAVWYFFLRKKTAPTTMLPAAVVSNSLPKLAPVEQVIVSPASQKSYVYPLGIGKDGSTFPLNEGDYVANGVETAILYNGELRPITAAYAARYAAGTWGRTKILDNIVYSSIPRGAVMDV